ncbi:MAG: hypothetical protein M3032_05745 [Verrucomicrobiota bacterium]|nr:hypothetical protein [Verrucomicrobiota bacterium]
MKALTSTVAAALVFVLASGAAEAKTAKHHTAKHHHSKGHFVYKDKKTGELKAAAVIEKYRGRIVPAKIDPRLDRRMVRAATIAQESARAHSKSRCWHYVKDALLAAGAVSSRPKTVYAKEAGEELVRSYGFKKLPIRDPYQAPVGAVLVYGARRAAGHVEIRTKTGFVSDFRNREPSRRPLIGVYAKI